MKIIKTNLGVRNRTKWILNDICLFRRSRSKIPPHCALWEIYAIPRPIYQCLYGSDYGLFGKDISCTFWRDNWSPHSVGHYSTKNNIF